MLEAWKVINKMKKWCPNYHSYPVAAHMQTKITALEGVGSGN